MEKYVDNLIKNLNAEVDKISGKIFQDILNKIEEKKSDVSAWPISFAIGSEISSNSRILASVIEKLDGYGFVVFEQVGDYVAVDLPPTQSIITDNANVNIKTEIDIVSASEAANLSVAGKKDIENRIFTTINKKIKEAALIGQRCVEINTKDKPINKNKDLIKLIYTRLSKLGFVLAGNFQKDDRGKIKFENIEVLKIKW